MRPSGWTHAFVLITDIRIGFVDVAMKAVKDAGMLTVGKFMLMIMDEATVVDGGATMLIVDEAALSKILTVSVVTAGYCLFLEAK